MSLEIKAPWTFDKLQVTGQHYHMGSIARDVGSGYKERDSQCSSQELNPFSSVTHCYSQDPSQIIKYFLRIT
jgi:hypothetical protein